MTSGLMIYITPYHLSFADVLLLPFLFRVVIAICPTAKTILSTVHCYPIFHCPSSTRGASFSLGVNVNVDVGFNTSLPPPIPFLSQILVALHTVYIITYTSILDTDNTNDINQFSIFILEMFPSPVRDFLWKFSLYLCLPWLPPISLVHVFYNHASKQQGGRSSGSG